MFPSTHNSSCLVIKSSSINLTGAVEIMRADPLGVTAAIIGTVQEEESGLVTMTSAIGANRIVDMLSGEQLPRIC